MVSIRAAFATATGVGEPFRNDLTRATSPRRRRTACHAGRGFGKKTKDDGAGEDWKKAWDSLSESDRALAEEAFEEISNEKKARKTKGKLNQCATCRGTGIKDCPFCKGTGKMTGFMQNTLVPCVPCKAKGNFGRPCPQCDGMGFLE